MYAKYSPKRPCGEESRRRILESALKLFSEQGFERTTVRQISKAASVNISAISYYFGDKNGLYIALYKELMCKSQESLYSFQREDLSLQQALNQLFMSYVEPLKQGETMRMYIRLFMREMIEPTGMWKEQVENNIIPKHEALLKLLQKHLNIATVDDDLQRLARCIIAMGVHLCMSCETIDRITPTLLADNAALDTMRERMTMFAMSMIDAEAARRKALTI
jgi:TetR/AcrR family transcriptional regulator, regulator of cefoperazone and chloramphenicol sensitivity